MNYSHILTALAVIALPVMANAHASLTPREAAAGKTYRAVIGIGHGCDGEATRTLRVMVPEGFYDAKPMPKAGWTLEVKAGPYATPFDNHGTIMTEGPREIIWSGGTLEDAWYDEFVIRGRVGADIAPGTVLYFPTVQECAGGTAEWTDVTGNRDLPNPAPGVTVDPDAAQGHSYELGTLSLQNPFSRATLPNAPVAGGFMTIVNGGDQDDRLVGAESAVAGRVELHEMAMEGDVMTMRQLADGLVLPAHQTVELKPGGYHIMFFDLKQPFVQGETVPVTLRFENAGEIAVELSVGAPNARGAGQPGHGGH